MTTRTRMAMTRLAVAALALSVAGCVLFPSAKQRALEKSPAYRGGYSDGCAAANAAGASYRYGPQRDKNLMRTNEAYRAGWNTGYSACRRTIAMPGSQPDSPIPEPSPGH